MLGARFSVEVPRGFCDVVDVATAYGGCTRRGELGKRFGSWIGRLLVVASAGMLAGVAAGGPPAARAASGADARRVLWRTNGVVAGVAMDGFQVAVADVRRLPASPGTGRPSATRCTRIEVVGARGGTPVRVSRHSAAFYCSGSLGGVALAGSRAYWLYSHVRGASFYQTILTGAPGSPERALVPARPHDLDRGPYLGPIAASGSSFAYSQWRREWLPPGCTPGNEGDCTSSAEIYLSLTLRGRRVAMPGLGGLVTSVDSGRATIVLHDGHVAIVSPHAPPVVVGPFSSLGSTQAVIAGRWLVVLSGNNHLPEAPPRRLWVFDATTGRPHGSFPVDGALDVDVWNGIAVYGTERRIIAIRLSNGHRRLIQQAARDRAIGQGPQIEAGGIVWETEPIGSSALFHSASIVWRVPPPAIR